MWIAKVFEEHFSLPSLLGSASQIAVAEKIRTRIFLDLVDEIVRQHGGQPLDSTNAEVRLAQYQQILEGIKDQSLPESKIFWELFRQDWSIWWLENRFASAQDFLAPKSN